MSNYYNPYHPNVSKSPKTCCCIPIKFIVLSMQAAALIFHIYLMCFKNGIISSKELAFVNILSALYIGFTFVVFLINHRFLMCTHLCLGIVAMVILVLYLGAQVYGYIAMASPYAYYNPDTLGNLLTAVAIVLVGIFYIAMCKKLIDALEFVPLLPEYTITQNVQQPSRGVDGSSESAHLIYSVYPKL